MIVVELPVDDGAGMEERRQGGASMRRHLELTPSRALYYISPNNFHPLDSFLSLSFSLWLRALVQSPLSLPATLQSLHIKIEGYTRMDGRIKILRESQSEGEQDRIEVKWMVGA